MLQEDEDYYGADDVEEILDAFDRFEATQGPPKRPRLDTPTDLTALQQEIDRLKAAFQEAQSDHEKTKARLLQKEGEITFMRRAKTNDEVKARALLQNQIERNQQLEHKMEDMKRSFKADLERSNTAHIFAKQESEAALRRARLRQSSQSPSPQKTALPIASTSRSPTVKIQNKRPSTEKFRGFKNAFATDLAPKQESASPPRHSPIRSPTKDQYQEHWGDDNGIAIDVGSDTTRDQILSFALTHYYVSPNVNSYPVANTLYSLMNCPLVDVPPEAAAEKDGLAQDLFIALSPSASSFDTFIRKACDSLTRLAQWFLKHEQNPPLFKCLALIASLCTFYPEVCVHHLSGPTDSADLLQLVHQAITTHGPKSQMLPTEKGKEKALPDAQQSESEAVVLPVIAILDALTWYMTADGVPRMEQALSTAPSILMSLLDPRNTPEILKQTVKLTSHLLGEPQFFRALMALNASGPSGPSLTRDAPSRTPLVDRLASLLAYEHKALGFEQLAHFHLEVMQALAAVALAHEDAIALMGESGNLVPKMLACISEDTTTLFETDGMGLPTLHARLITRRCATCLRLLYVISSPNSLRAKLHAAMPFYNGIMQMFTVAVGRLGAAEAPFWLEDDERRELEGLAECALVLLDAVLSPEEVDSIWALYDSPDEDEETQDTDEALIADQQMEELDMTV